MGNANTNVTSGIKDQASGGTKKLYNFIDLKGGGELVELMQRANRTKNYTELDKRIVEGLSPFLYNKDGEGKIVHISELIKARCSDRGINLGKRSSQGGVLDGLKEIEALANGKDFHLGKYGSQYKELCWKLEEMGAVGETALHVCLLNATSIHADLAKRLLRYYPKLINDIYISDEYFGENMLHMAIVNEDPAMVRYLLDNGCDYNQRACGNFFTADDQKAKRKDSLDHEWFILPEESSYEGYTYWGEFPLGFAACLGQEECVRLLRAKGSDPNLQDSNGNTVLHMLVVHDKKMRDRTNLSKLAYTHPEEMFDLIVDLGGSLHIKNRQGLTPLTLAAKLGRKDMYDHILEIEREVYWVFGNVTCAAYPLEHIDTISETGEINTKSALYNIVYGADASHLAMIDGVAGHLLDEKWKTFAKFRFLQQFFLFLLYFVLTLVAIYLRPGTDLATGNRTNIITINGTNYTQNVTVRDPCFLLRLRGNGDIQRYVIECLVLAGAVIYIFMSMREIYHQGYRIFFQTLRSAPVKSMFLMSNFFVILIVPGRAACAYSYEDWITVLAILTTAPYFLFFCRGFRLVGPFVVMIYRMIQTDLLRFVVIYIIFLVGFSQAMYVVFRGYESTIFNDPGEAIMGMFIMSLGEFGDIYESFSKTAHPYLPRVIFVIYMVLVTLLLINMLIAMMAATYEAINDAQNEWLRQRAGIIVVVEQSVTTEDRRLQRIKYSQPMTDGRRALVIRWHQTKEEREELEKARKKSKSTAKQKKVIARKPDGKSQMNRFVHKRTDNFTVDTSNLSSCNT